MFGFFKRPARPAQSASASAAKDRLQILLAHERSDRTRAELLPLLQRDIIAAVRRHVQVEGEAVAVDLQSRGDVSTLEINVEIPESRFTAAGKTLSTA